MTIPDVPSHSRRAVLRGGAALGIIIVGGKLLTACGSDEQNAATTTLTAATAVPTTTGAADSTAEPATTDSPATTEAPASSTPPPKVSVSTQLSWVKTTEFAGYYLADSEGFFGQEGIAIDLLGGGPTSPSAEQNVAGGAAQFGTATSLSGVSTAVLAGSDLVVLGAQLQQNMGALISLPKNPVNSLADLVGKRLGIFSPAYESFFTALLISAGLEPDFELITVGFDPSPLVEGQVDVYVGFLNTQPIVLQSRGIDPVVLPLQDLGVKLYNGHPIVTRAYLTDNRPTVVRYMRALIKGHELNLRGPEPGARLAAEKYGIDLGLLVEDEVKANEIYIKAQQSELTAKKGLFWMDLDYVAGPVYESLAKFGLKGLPDPASYIDLTVLEEIYDGGTSLL